MAKEPKGTAARDAAPQKSHLLVRSRLPRFRRAGIEFTAQKWSPLALAELKPEQRKLIENEPALEAHLVGPDDPRLLDALSSAGDGLDELTAPQLRGMLRDAVVEVERLRGKVRELLAERGDMPPEDGEPPPGSLG